MKIRIAYIEEPPFYWTAENGEVAGSDVELAEVILRAMGVSEISYVPTTFEEFLPGVEEGRWDMNVPIFISAERQRRVTFSVPVWSLVDGFIVPAGNPRQLQSYESMAVQSNARLATIAGTIQIDAAKAAGMHAEQIVVFKDQPDAIAALQAGKVDAFVGTAVGNRALLQRYPGLDAVSHPLLAGSRAPVGGFSFSKANTALTHAVNDELQRYLGSADHRMRMKNHGITDSEIDGALAARMATRSGAMPT
ncbi:transporter substrate-binding domain-containing protein [Achromobacter sp. Marseille-Q0513]|uniref:transporter substrate-binding domain-containing protein n=1 Tax=Achromobacter sp. Marseille-Q0513 TaxID=2829161 RepID=UPI001B99F6CF|nr:transporter substrate-binding domain-containing protein [Achromobacter sp. Marseille-Q0513]MBR8655180.1 transporter substrate-binding domain-containing protein [Achromobacter sp. Marseille-Q0513]